MDLIGLLVVLLILGIIIYVINLVIAQMSLPPVVKTIAYLIVGLVFLFYLLNLLGISVPTIGRLR